MNIASRSGIPKPSPFVVPGCRPVPSPLAVSAASALSLKALVPPPLPLSPSSSFFHPVNALCKSRWNKVEYDSDSDGFEDAGSERPVAYPCVSCHLTFPSISLLNSHTSRAHCNACAQCGKTFPTKFLLDRHQTEIHDPFFKVKMEREGSAFRGFLCLVQVRDCEERIVPFHDDKKKKLWLAIRFLRSHTRLCRIPLIAAFSLSLNLNLNLPPHTHTPPSTVLPFNFCDGHLP